MEKNRIEAFSDGVFAIAVTLLVLNIGDVGIGKMPIGTFLWEVLPDILTYILSFLIIGVYWVAHHTMMHYVKTVDRNALWINNLTLLCIAFMPFSTRLVSRYSGRPAALFVYCLTLSAANLTGSWFWWYVTQKRRHVDRTVSDAFARKVLLLHISPIAVYIFAFFLSCFSEIAGFVLIGIVPAFFILPNPLFRKALSEQGKASGQKREVNYADEQNCESKR